MRASVKTIFHQNFHHARQLDRVAHRASSQASLFIVLPHPGLLPKEKEKRLPRHWKYLRLDWPDNRSENRKRESAILS